MNRENLTDTLLRYFDRASDIAYVVADSLKEVDFRECLLDIDNQLYDMHNQISEYLEE